MSNVVVKAVCADSQAPSGIMESTDGDGQF